jgi:cellulose biosynthesis protein BcsQ
MQVATLLRQNTLKSIALSSYRAGEGKSFLTASLGFGFAELLSKQVLIIDTFTPPNEVSPFKAVVEMYEAMASLKADTSPQEQRGYMDLMTIKESNNGPYFFLNTRGCLEPSDKRESSDIPAASVFQLNDVLLGLRASYDVTFLDCGPITLNAKGGFDPLIIGAQVDGVLLVVNPTSLARMEWSKVKNELSRAKVNLLGVISNPWSKIPI